MLNKIKDGFLLGLGFGIALLLVYSFYMMFIWPAEIKRTMAQFNESNAFTSESSINDIDVKLTENSLTQSMYTPEEKEKLNHFYELGVDEKIELASAIAIGSFQEGEDGRQKAIIDEFLKKEPDLELYYEVGDEYTSMSAYPRGEHFDITGSNFIVFFAGNPPKMKSGMTYHGERISGLNDIPVTLLREKCK